MNRARNWKFQLKAFYKEVKQELLCELVKSKGGEAQQYPKNEKYDNSESTIAQKILKKIEKIDDVAGFREEIVFASDQFVEPKVLQLHKGKKQVNAANVEQFDVNMLEYGIWYISQFCSTWMYHSN